MPSPPNLQSLLKALTERNVDFVLVGGMAQLVHGGAHVTYDVDLTFAADRDNLKALAAALEPFSPRPRDFPDDVPFIWDDQTINSSTMLTLTTTAGEVDLLRELAGVESYQALRGRAISVELHGMAVNVASLEDLIAMKEAVGRPKDQLHLIELRALKELRG